MKKLLISIMLCALGSGNLAFAGEKTAVQEGHARIRFFGQAVISLTYYGNKTCYGGKGVAASRNGFGGAFGNKSTISLGMPETPNVINLKDRDGILAKSFYREYAVKAAEPLTILGALYETTGGSPFFRNSTGVINSCKNLAGSFVPENGIDYEVTFDVANHECRLNVKQIASTAEGVKLIPTMLTPAEKCTAAENLVMPMDDVRAAKLMCKEQHTQCIKTAKLENDHADDALAECKSDYAECRNDNVMPLVNATPIGQCKVAMKTCKEKITDAAQATSPDIKPNRALFNGCVADYKNCLTVAKQYK